ncbi:ABC transporter transmembrane domain-containing protein [Microvirga sp. M2]|uniref:ABC transporter transmembrane domain-containing protein n=1 Tax=Microvirga sp. M2 TaxID=3073270 RepID=UPI0039C328BE
MTEPQASGATPRSCWAFLTKLIGHSPTTEREQDALDPTIYRFILRRSLKDQVIVVALTLASFPFLYLTLELPKTIVNHAIAGGAFPQVVLGIELDRIAYLATLCLIFLALVVLNGWFKFHINVMKGRLGERMLRRLRYDLYLRTLRFPLPYFTRISAGEIIAMITAELEPVAGFIGDSFALPIYQGGTLLTIGAFMFVQDPLLGLAAVSLYPAQAYVIPKLQRKVRQLGRRRVRRIRHLSNRIGDSIAARVEIRANDYAPYQLADIFTQLGEIYDIRYEIYRRKFLIKFLNNFLNQLTPFFFYLIGGYLVIVGRLSFGALVAILAAHKDLAAPWKELLDFYQDQQDVAIKYQQVVEQFEVPEMVGSKTLLERPASLPSLVGDLAVAGVSYRTSDGATRLEGIDFGIPQGGWVAAVGPGSGGRFELATLLARLDAPTSGRIELGSVDINAMPMSVTGRRIGYSGPTPYLLPGPLRDTLLMGLRHPKADSRPGPGRQEDWIDYEQAGIAGPSELAARMVEVLRRVDFDAEVYGFGLLGHLDPSRHAPEAPDKLVMARVRFNEELVRSGLTHLIDTWSAVRYNAQASVAENLLFGLPLGSTFETANLARQPYVRGLLDQVGLTQDLMLIGWHVAKTMVAMSAERQVDRELMKEFGIASAGDVASLRAILERADRVEPRAPASHTRERLLTLALRVVVGHHRFVTIDHNIQQRIVQARQSFAGNLPLSLRDAVAFFDPAQFNAAATIEDNVLFGKRAASDPDSHSRIQALISQVVDELDLRSLVIEVGLDYPVGAGGSRLSPGQRQKASLARALLKRPDLLVLNDATSTLDGRSRARVFEGLREEVRGQARTVFWSMQLTGLVRQFDRVLVIGEGRLIAQGPPDELMRPGATLAGLKGTE